MKMKGNEMDTAANALFLQEIDQHIAPNAKALWMELNNVKVPRMLDIVSYARQNELRKFREDGAVEAGVTLAYFPEPIAFV